MTKPRLTGSRPMTDGGWPALVACFVAVGSPAWAEPDDTDLPPIAVSWFCRSEQAVRSLVKLDEGAFQQGMTLAIVDGVCAFRSPFMPFMATPVEVLDRVQIDEDGTTFTIVRLSMQGYEIYTTVNDEIAAMLKSKLGSDT